MSRKYCIVVPHYNHARQLLAFLPEIITTGLTCILVDDGSDETNLTSIKTAAAQHPQQLVLVEHSYNRGKGASVRSGLYRARSLGFSHAVQIDADGQHNVEDIARFVAASEVRPDAFICGRPVFDESIPKVRLHGRKITTFWVALETLSLQIKDGLCGFRLYPLKQVERIFDRYYLGPRMDFDPELLVKAVWADVPLFYIDTRVVYPEGSQSHFRYLRDNLMLIALHTRLMLGMLRHLPVLLYRRLIPKLGP